MSGIDTTPDAAAEIESATPPDLSPPTDAPAPAEDTSANDTGAGAAPSAPQGFDRDSLLQAMREEREAMFRQLAPKPAAAPKPWQDPNYYSLEGVAADKQAAEFARRQQAHVEAIAEEKAAALLADFERKVAGAMQGQAAMFQSQFAADPVFSKIKPHFDRYVQRGYDPADARRLAELDAGVARNPAAAAGPRPVAQPPRHAAASAARQAPAVAKPSTHNRFDANAREARFYEIAAQQGWEV